MEPAIPARPTKAGLDVKAIGRQTEALRGLIRLLSEKGFYGTLSIRFEAGGIVKCDSMSSLHIKDIEQLLKVPPLEV